MAALPSSSPVLSDSGERSSCLRNSSPVQFDIHLDNVNVTAESSSCPATSADPPATPMHPVITSVTEYAVQNQHLSVPLFLGLLGTIATAYSPVQHSLFVTAVSWGLIWLATIFRVGIWSSTGSRNRKITSWLAGAFLALSQVCDRAPCDKEGIWSMKGLLPLLVVLLSRSDMVLKHAGLPSYTSIDDLQSDGTTSLEKRQGGSFRTLTVVTISAFAALASRYTLGTTTALSLSSVIFTATGLVLFENALKGPQEESDDGRRGLMSANGTYLRHRSLQGVQREQHFACLRDISVVIMVACSAGTYLFEPSINSRAISWEPVYRHFWGDWKSIHYQRTVEQCLLMILVNVLVNILLYMLLFQQGAVHTSFLYLFSYLCASLIVFVPTFSGIWFTVVFAVASLLYLSIPSSSTAINEIRTTLRSKRVLLIVTAISFGLFLFRVVSGSHSGSSSSERVPNLTASSPETPFAPIPVDTKKGHPAYQLIDTAEKEFEEVLNKQSKTLEETVQEYRRRNGVAPPPHFDKWYEFARRNNVLLIDEFDTINESLLPFWALQPSTIRSRVRLALAGYEENALVAMMIRDGNVVKVENGPEWQQQATIGMMKNFIQFLPDMDLAFNIHDEPRVVVPDGELALLVAQARDKAVTAAITSQTVRNSFSARPSDLGDGKRFSDASISRFNRFAHQKTWTHARLSCPITSQARVLEDDATDNLTSYAVAPLNYVYNQTAFSDICNSPSIASRFGFFERPNAFNIIHELTPVFSQSKISSFQDILYPSPWYWFGKVGYDSWHDTTWENKTNSLYWRGSTTGGFSRNGGWRRQHRQHIVKRLNRPDTAKILVSKGDDGVSDYELQEVERNELDRYIDVKFSHVGQCDPADCKAQEEFFKVVEHVDGQDAWYYKHLLDMDGNAFSGRFYAFLKSRSLTYKMAVFREWHQEWLKPWVHYVPLSLIGDEHLDLVRWFGGGRQDANGKEILPKAHEENKGGNGDSIGERKAREIAERSTDWSGKVLRNVDFEVWFFRLLLEYGRIIDDNRESIGYSGP
ncbi:glycosyltransferase family 90 protein [Aaosphaeria arxii CBS 175.79]|uniref:Glycosyltransferase family 90 protein n=1 Tax=Aaosphaeria arxii CBS 175.79 TaxID=1450172 RepID=A0A6A5X8F8_9PLEO|nr:glycosyltransferase family 90 protein [Aaosphaeria arxii CBS 175.79]KAF2009190.1 glycosyltransferase family 90 protein [Aaosphaeria arxii CBS 175.79]